VALTEEIEQPKKELLEDKQRGEELPEKEAPPREVVPVEEIKQPQEEQPEEEQPEDELPKEEAPPTEVAPVEETELLEEELPQEEVATLESLLERPMVTLRLTLHQLTSWPQAVVAALAMLRVSDEAGRSGYGLCSL
jgi:uncharacterized membrane protein